MKWYLDKYMINSRVRIYIYDITECVQFVSAENWAVTEQKCWETGKDFIMRSF